MILSDKYNWNSVQQLPSKLYTCGYCGNPLTSEKEYFAVSQKNNCFIYCI